MRMKKYPETEKIKKARKADAVETVYKFVDFLIEKKGLM